jgi:hypothetical protein
MNELAADAQNPELNPASRRRNRLVSSWAAVQLIYSAFANKELKIRQRDKVSDVMLTFAIIYGIAIFLFPVQAHPWVGIADLVFGITFLLYFTQRFGIITTFNERQALLVAELLFCMLLIGIYIAVNIGAIYVWFKLASPCG